ncbi:MAG: hypothetical protein NTX50_17995, partial [Candidatus Sumerlaeota bacterium]|nr:hypothetical protein [Candidatus Sumerlaeota bacterium]
TETQKTVGRTHAIHAALVDGLFKQWDTCAVATNGLILNLSGNSPLPSQTAMPKLPAFNRRDAKSEDQRGLDLRAGFSLDLWLKVDALASPQSLIDSRDSEGKGILVSAADDGSLRITLCDGRSEAAWSSDCKLLQAGKLHHAVITVDGGPKIITFVVDGALCDGGDQRQFGWGRFSPNMGAPNGSPTLAIAQPVQSLRIYSRALRTSEAVGNFRAGVRP